MSSIVYTRLFNLKVSHDYFKDGVAKGLIIQPTPQTSRQLRNGRMLFRVKPDGVVVFYSAAEDEVTPLVNMGKDLRLIFSISIIDLDEFMNITNLDESSTRKFKSSNMLYFKNDPASVSTDAANPEQITHTLVDSLRDSLFTYSFTIAAAPPEVLFKLTDESGNPVSAGKDGTGSPLPNVLTVKKDVDGVYRQQVDLRDKATGKYTVTIRNSADTLTLKEEVIYADGSLVPSKIVGIVDIIYTAATNHIYAATEEYELKFRRQSTIWKYFIADKNKKVDLVANDLLITDTGSGGGTPYGVYNFSRIGAEPNTDVRVNGLDTVVFKSNVPIPFFEQPKLNIELRKNPGNVSVIQHLPNPSHRGVTKEDAGQPASEIYVFI
ncbi:MAG: hypothetical protein HC859_02160 [Bacteroidia bacterium]|nr:hypothetical protein [Bacteroidia bacterium]